MNNLVNLLGNFDSFDRTFDMFSSMSIIITIISAIVGIVIFAVVVTVIVRAVKSSKQIGKAQQSVFESIQEVIDGENSQFTKCEYCGLNNDKSSKTCSGCGANLNHENKK